MPECETSCVEKYTRVCAMGLRKDVCYKCPIGTKRRLEYAGEPSNENAVNIALMNWFSHATWVPAYEIVNAVKDHTTRELAEELNMAYSSVRDRLVKLEREGYIRKEGNKWYSMQQ